MMAITRADTGVLAAVGADDATTKMHPAMDRAMHIFVPAVPLRIRQVCHEESEVAEERCRIAPGWGRLPKWLIRA